MSVTALQRALAIGRIGRAHPTDVTHLRYAWSHLRYAAAGRASRWLAIPALTARNLHTCTRHCGGTRVPSGQGQGQQLQEPAPSELIGPAPIDSDLEPLLPTEVQPDDIEEPDESRKEAQHEHASHAAAGSANVAIQGLDLAAVAAETTPAPLFTAEEMDALVADLKAYFAAQPPAAETAASAPPIPPLSPTPPGTSAPSAATTDAASSSAPLSSTSSAASTDSTRPRRPFLASWSVKEVCSWYLQVEEQLQSAGAAASKDPASAQSGAFGAQSGQSFLSLLVRHRIDGSRLLSLTSDPQLIPWVPASLLQRILYLRGLDTYSPMFESAADDAQSADPNMRHLQAILHSTVKIFCTSTAPDFARPWQQLDQVDSSSSGFVISGRRIIGNAHGATSATSLRVRRHGDATKYKAKVEVISHEADLVILTVDSDAFWEGMRPLHFGHVPRLQDTVIVVGFPTGGDSICVTKGVVSRILVSSYAHSDESLLTVQIDAAINSGNSGGPVLMGGAVVGVAFQGVQSLQSVGYIIPIPVVQHFLTDLQLHGGYTGFPSFHGLTFQKLENESLKKYFGLRPDETGVVVMERAPLDDAHAALRPGDVVTHIDGIPVADDGSIFFRHGERISARYLPSSKFVGDTVRMRIVRHRRPMEVSFTLQPKRNLVPTHLYDTQPSYLILAGLVFTPLSRPYLVDTFGRSWHKRAPIDLVRLAYYGKLERPDQQVVLLSTILVDDVNSGYSASFHNVQLQSLNGHAINNLAHLVQIVEQEKKAGAEFLRFDFTLNRVIVLESSQAFTANERILRQNSIEHDRSADLRGQTQDHDETEPDDDEGGAPSEESGEAPDQWDPSRA